ncbi:MAG: flagellar hook-length control protein FliK [Gammaproteobacteria bacterium]|nr:flagellar hook-length control protein FliK [Gammaproteobacteria bacterium]
MTTLSEMEFSAATPLNQQQGGSSAQAASQNDGGLFFSMLGMVQAGVQTKTTEVMDVSDQKLMTLEEIADETEALPTLVTASAEPVASKLQIAANLPETDSNADSTIPPVIVASPAETQPLGTSLPDTGIGSETLTSLAEQPVSGVKTPVIEGTDTTAAAKTTTVTTTVTATATTRAATIDAPPVRPNDLTAQQAADGQEMASDIPVKVATTNDNNVPPVETVVTTADMKTGMPVAGAKIPAAPLVAGGTTVDVAPGVQQTAAVDANLAGQFVDKQLPTGQIADSTPAIRQLAASAAAAVNVAAGPLAQQVPTDVTKSFIENQQTTDNKTAQHAVSEQQNLVLEDTTSNVKDVAMDSINTTQAELKLQTPRSDALGGKSHFTFQQSGAFIETSYESISTLGGVTASSIGALSGQTGASAEVSPGNTAPALPVPTLSLKQPGWDRSLGANIAFMLKEDINTASIKVKPAELGPMNIQLSVQSDQLNVSIAASQAQTREALEASLPRLREQFASLGFSEVNVNIGSQGQAGKGQGNMAGNSDVPANNGYFGTTEEGFMEDNSLINVRRPTHNGLLDTFA